MLCSIKLSRWEKKKQKGRNENKTSGSQGCWLPHPDTEDSSSGGSSNNEVLPRTEPPKHMRERLRHSQRRKGTSVPSRPGWLRMGTAAQFPHGFDEILYRKFSVQEGYCCSRSVKLFCVQHQRAKRMTKNGRSIAKRARDEAAGSLAPLTGGGLPCNARLKTTIVQCRRLVLCTTLLFLRSTE